ncbi:hypothetical protein VP01_6326g1 [Puccinia sorghi]|uniref:CCHC-type domain-containing protein n=1 Tax=Puccinia sorghi TaxID=27349 RepID=A0A0L6UIB0_9BASI|nr:hypothetical protein VP01_6326g1 [Puccinia sorghi]
MSSVVSQKTKILLTPDNYVTWLIPMEAKLHKIRALDIVTGKTLPPSNEKSDDKSNYVKLNEDAYAEIVDCLDTEVINYISATMSSSDRFNGYILWQLLKNKYAGTDLTARSVALDLFLNIKFTSVNKFIIDMRSANQKLALASVHLDEQVKTLLMLKKLPSKFYSFRDIISMGFATETFDKILKRLESYAIQNELDMPNTSLDSTRSSEQITLYTPSSSQLNPNSKFSSPVCPHCKKPGHRPHNCWVKYPEKAPKTEAAHLTVQDNYNQLASQSSSTNPTDFSYFTTADGVRHHVDEIKFEGVTYY